MSHSFNDMKPISSYVVRLIEKNACVKGAYWVSDGCSLCVHTSSLQTSVLCYRATVGGCVCVCDWGKGWWDQTDHLLTDRSKDTQRHFIILKTSFTLLLEGIMWMHAHTHTHIVIPLLRDVPAFVCPFPCQYEGYWWDSTATDLSERGTPPLPQTFTTPAQHCFYTFVGNVFKTFWNNHWLYFLSQNLDSALTLTYILLEPVSSSSSAVFANFTFMFTLRSCFIIAVQVKTSKSTRKVQCTFLSAEAYCLQRL